MNRQPKYLTVGKMLFLLSWILFATACNKEEESAFTGGGQTSAELVFNLSAPTFTLETRASAVSAYPTDPEQWSDWERVVDGRDLYRVTVMLFDTENETLAASRDIYRGDGSDVDANNGFCENGTVNTNASVGTAVKATFTNLEPGTYKMAVVANHSAYTAADGTDENGNTITREYPGMTHATYGSLTDLIEDTKNRTKSLSDLYAYKLDAGEDDFIAPRTPQVLTLVKDITLEAGHNTVSGELIRTYARLRIEVSNNSGTTDLNVYSLTFSPNFAQRYENLFEESFQATNKGTLTVTSTDAVTPFEGTADAPFQIPHLDTSVEGGGSDAVVFDTYIHETRWNGTDTLAYDLKMGYNVQSDITTTVWKSGTTPTAASSLVSGNRYLIYNSSNNRILVDDSRYGVGTDTSHGPGDEFGNNQDVAFWIYRGNGRFESVYSPGYYLGIYQSGGSYVAGLTTSTTNSSLTIGNTGTMYRSADRRTYYLRLNNGTLQTTTSSGSATAFSFYELTEETRTTKEDVTKTQTFHIPLHTIDAETGTAFLAEEIRRNDFINIQITISYNENNGAMEFLVEDWTKVDNDMTFD